MNRIEACRICLITDVKLERIQGSLEKNITNVFGCNIQFSSDLPDYACYECKAMIAKYNKFKKKYFAAQSLLFNILQNHGMVTEKELKQLDRQASNLNSNLSIIHLGNQIQLCDMELQCIPLEAIPITIVNLNGEETHDSDSGDELPLKYFEKGNENKKKSLITLQDITVDNNWGQPSPKIQKFIGNFTRQEDLLLLKEFEESTLINANSLYLQEEESEVESTLLASTDTDYAMDDCSPAYNPVIESPAYNQVNESPYNQVNESPYNQVNESPYNQVNESPYNQVNVSPVYNQVNENPVHNQASTSPAYSQAKQSPSGTISALSVQILENQRVILSKLAGMSEQLDIIAKNYNSTESSEPNAELEAAIPAIENKKQLDRFEKDLKDPNKKKILHSKYSMYFKGRGQGLNCAYILIDALFSRKFLTKCSWAGGSRTEDKKLALKSYKNTIIFLYELIQECDSNFSLVDCYTFIKTMLRYSAKRLRSKGVRMSTCRSRRGNPGLDPFDVELENVLTSNCSTLEAET